MASRLIRLLLTVSFLFLTVCSLSSLDFNGYGKILEGLINGERTGHGLNPLITEDAAEIAAQKYAEDLADRNVLSHTGKNGTRVEERYRNAGGTGLSSGENLAVSDSPYEIFNAWMKSHTHKDNILNPGWNSFGLGFAGISDKRFIAVLILSNSLWRKTAVSCTDNYLIIKGIYNIPDNAADNTIKVSINRKIYSFGSSVINITVPCSDINDSVLPLWFSFYAPGQNGLKEIYTDVDFIEIPYYDN